MFPKKVYMGSFFKGQSTKNEFKDCGTLRKSSPASSSFQDCPEEFSFKDEKCWTDLEERDKETSLQHPRTSSMKTSKKERVVCQVCGDIAAGFYCGAYTCEACKKFFIRSTQPKQLRYVCRNQGRCEITKESRVWCQYCRYQKCLQLNMTSPGKVKHPTKSVQEIPCRVCSAPSSGFHFGAITCEGCKGFFRRMIKDKESIDSKCKKQGKCVINSIMRNGCKACRYEKCLNKGMSVDGSRIGRQPNAVKHAISLEAKKQMILKKTIQNGKQETPDNHTGYKFKKQASRFGRQSNAVKHTTSLEAKKKVSSKETIHNGKQETPENEYFGHSHMESSQPSEIESQNAHPSDLSVISHHTLQHFVTNDFERDVFDRGQSPPPTTVDDKKYTPGFQVPAVVPNQDNIVLQENVAPPSDFPTLPLVNVNSDFISEEECSQSGLYFKSKQSLDISLHFPRAPSFYPGGNQNRAMYMKQGLLDQNYPMFGLDCKNLSDHKRNYYSYQNLCPYSEFDQRQNAINNVSPRRVRHEYPNDMMNPNGHSKEYYLPMNTMDSNMIRHYPHNGHFSLKYFHNLSRNVYHTVTEDLNRPNNSFHYSNNSHDKHLPLVLGVSEENQSSFHDITKTSIVHMRDNGSHQSCIKNDQENRGFDVVENDEEKDNDIEESHRARQNQFPSHLQSQDQKFSRDHVHNMLSLAAKELSHMSMVERAKSGVYDEESYSTIDTTWKRMMKHFDFHTKCIVRFAKKIPSFKDLSIENQISLLRRNTYPLVVLNQGRTYEPNTGFINYFNFTAKEQMRVQELFPELDILHSHFMLSGFMASHLRLTSIEYAYLSCLMILTSDSSDILEIEKINRLKEFYMDSLFIHQSENFPQSNLRFGEMLLRLPEFVQFSNQHNVAVGQIMKKHKQLHIPSLYAEMYNSCG